MVEIKCSPEALCSSVTDLGARDPWRPDDPYFSIQARRDNNNPDMPVNVYGGTARRYLPPGTSDEDVMAITMMDYYLHEMGEHLQIGNLELNHHKQGGLKNYRRLLKLLSQYVDQRNADH